MSSIEFGFEAYGQVMVFGVLLSVLLLPEYRTLIECACPFFKLAGVL